MLVVHGTLINFANILLLGAIAALPLAADGAGSADEQTIVCHRKDGDLRFDGRLNDAVWTNKLVASAFFQCLINSLVHTVSKTRFFSNDSASMLERRKTDDPMAADNKQALRVSHGADGCLDQPDGALQDRGVDEAVREVDTWEDARGVTQGRKQREWAQAAR